MRISTAFLALGTLVAMPAAAQVNLGVGGGVNVGAGASVDTGGILGGVTDTVDRAVTAADRTLNQSLGGDLRLATRNDVTVGTEVRDSRGRRIGAVQSLHGNMAVVVHGNRSLHVPLSALYRSANGLVTSLTSRQLQASAAAQANAGAQGSVRN